MPSFVPLVNKARRPRFELHLSIYDLNNVPLVSGISYIKWHLVGSIHGEHRGRTARCPLDRVNHRVSYNYFKMVPLRISIDRNNNLSEAPIEFEIMQEMAVATGSKDERITLGTVRLNLSEYVEESENIPRKSIAGRNATSFENSREKEREQGHRRLSSSASKTTSASSRAGASPARSSNSYADEDDDLVEEGIVRRYLMQDSKINSTLKIGILMVQIDGDRNYVAPPLKTAPTFGGIAGIMSSETAETVDEGGGLTPGPGATATTNALKSRDTSELQDMYRRALAASWSCQPGELPADECIEDIFSGGDGWKSPKGGDKKQRGRHHREESTLTQGSRGRGPGNTSDEEAAGGTLRPGDVNRLQQSMLHDRTHSGSSGKSSLTARGFGDFGGPLDSSGSNAGGIHTRHHPRGPHRRQSSRGEENSAIAHTGFEDSGTGSSMTPTIGSSGDLSKSGRKGFRQAREVDEFDVRDDLVSWTLPGTVT